MPIRRTLLGVLAVGAGSPLPAQERTVGDVGEIVVVGRLAGCAGAGPAGSTPRVQILRAGQLLTVRPGQRERVYLGDEYRVERHTDVRLIISSKQLGKGTFTLVPQLLCRPRNVDRTFPPFGAVDTATYEVARSAEGMLQLGVVSGGAFVTWHNNDRSRGPRLVVVAAGNVATVPGTAFAVAADRTAGVAAYYVRDGTVRFPSAGDGTATAGQLVVLRRGARAPQPFASPPAPAAAARDVADHLALFPVRHSWIGRRVRDPWTWVGVAVGGTVLGCRFLSDTWCGVKPTPGRAQGRVRINIPL